jgi:hypothetical protein
MPTNQRDDSDALESVVSELAGDLLDRRMPLAAVEGSLRAAGVDPDRLRDDGLQLATQLLERRRLFWQEEARRRIANRAPLVARIAQLASMTKDDLLLRLGDLRGDPALGPSVAAAFRKRKPEESSAEELRELLQEVELLRSLGATEPGGEDDDT